MAADTRVQHAAAQTAHGGCVEGGLIHGGVVEGRVTPRRVCVVCTGELIIRDRLFFINSDLRE